MRFGGGFSDRRPSCVRVSTDLFVVCRPLAGVDELSSLVLPSWRVGDLLFLLEQRMLLLELSPTT